MDKGEILKKARAVEFWNKYLIETTNLSDPSFFGGINLKSETSSTLNRTYLNLTDVEEVAKLCKYSALLAYNFYSNVLGLLLSYYEEDFVFLSPVNQFDHAKENNEVFFIPPQIDYSESFKILFSTGKVFLLEAAAQTLDMSFIRHHFEEKGTFEKISQFGLIVGDTDHQELRDTVKTLFRIVLASDQPYLEITVKGEMYDPKLLGLFADNFNTLLQQSILKIYEPVSDLEFSGKLEKDILRDINEVTPYFSLENNVVALIDHNCQERGEAVAISHGKDQVTYGELFRSSNQLSRYITANLGLGSDDLIGMMLPRSIQMVKGILSVWKSGAAYVPIATDIQYEGLLQMIENSKLKAIISDDQFVLEQLAAWELDIPVLNLNVINQNLTGFSDTRIDYQIAPNDLAYVIYTSGSTGRPKGVMIEHIGMTNHIGAKVKEMGIDTDSIVAQNAPHTFDISIWQLFSPLVAGGRGIIYNTDFLPDVSGFLKAIATDRITVLELVPSYLLEMLYQLENDKKELEMALKIVILNAETLTKTTVKRWQSLYPQIPILNTYGATEVSDDMSHYFIDEDLDSYSVPVMKKPIQHFEVHIVDENKRPVPVGVTGEILLAGPCVGRGYINDEEKTKAAFLTGPLKGITSQQRIYKTGDLGRFMANGTMEFIGRNDNQVKILGHRIELDAIENIASGIEKISSCKAVAFQDKQLIALYYVADEKIEKPIIEAELLKKLPAYMLPSAYVHLSAFPLTENGKINKKLLPDPELSGSSGRSEYVAPANETEIVIARIWEKILEVGQVGVRDNFFELGGHSLKLMRLKNEYHKVFNAKIELKTFFEHPLLQSHADLIGNAVKKKYKTIKKIKNAVSYAISDAQKRLWILSQFEGGAAVYNMPFQVVLNSSIQVSVLQKAITAVIERHEILRTVFKEDETGEVRQWILQAEELKCDLSYEDLTATADGQLRAEEIIKEDALTAFDLENGPLFRTFLYKIKENEYIFYYNIHHIIGDGWSTEVLIKDVLAYYEAYSLGEKPKLPKLAIQYKDYAAWQLAQLEEPNFVVHQKYWTDQFTGNLPVLDLPANLSRPALKTYTGKRLGTYLDHQLSAGLKAFCQQNGGSLFIGLLASLNALFYKYTNQSEFIIGSPIAGRDHKELEDQIGFYVNTLALRNAVNAEENFLELFLNIRQNTLNAYQHQQYPFDKLVEDLTLNRDMGRSPLFDVMLVLQNDGEKKRRIAEETINDITDYGQTLSKFDLTFTFWEVDGCISLHVDYNIAVYQQDMVSQLLIHFKQLLSALLQAPDEKLGYIDYLSATEKSRLLEQFNDTESNYPLDKTILDYLSGQVTENPDNIALIYEDQQLTYLELEQRSNQLAAYLLARGLQLETLVPICLDRSFEMIIAIVAILKAGGAYVPVDPGYPKERISYILEDTGAAFILSVNAYAALFDGMELVDLNDFEYHQYSTVSVSVDVKPDHLAYCIYTSGTTGQPKGVLNQHSGLINRLFWMRDNLEITADSVLLQKTPYVFDVSVWELTMPLITGCKLVIAAPGGHTDPDYLQNLIAHEKVSIVHFVPSMLGVFLEFVKQDGMKSIRHVVCSGEALPAAMVARFQKSLPGLRIHNLYGPTEAAIDVTTIDLTDSDTDKHGVSIGKPVANTQLYVVNEFHQMQPVGVMGELLIGGVQVSRGYLNKPELTREKFVTDTFGKYGFLYKTGDLVRWLPDGNIEFLGRKDDQVKIRGHRIEPEEIAHHIRLKKGIIEAMVMARDNGKAEKELVAYLVSAEKETTEELSAYLSERLPTYMLPAYYMQIAQMPLTSNGKVDRRSLPAPELSEMHSSVAYVAPENEVEKTLIEIWSKVLGRDSHEIGIDAGFFTIGGNSLKIIKLRNEIQQYFSRSVPLVALFQYTTVRLQAGMIRNGYESEAFEEAGPFQTIKDDQADIAVIGMSIKAPGHEDIEAFWNNLKAGVETIQHFTEEELLEAGVPENLLKDERYIRSGSYLNGKENFDAAFFGYLPGEARLMDPQTRVFHEVVWSAIENAGYDPACYKGLVGLYAGSKINVKWQAHSLLNRQGAADSFAAAYLSDKDYLNSLIAHKLNLRGAVSTVNTACSTSLVAVHQAVKSLQSGENDIAVAGGITLRSNLKEGYLYEAGMINSNDGHNRAFDTLSSGTISGEGAGAVVLKRLDRAIADGDAVLAVIKGTAVNNDGNRKVGFTAPSIEGQVEVIKSAQMAAGVDAKTIGYIEAHGTATRLGDPIEVQALNQAFGFTGNKYCALGTVKSNMGHLDSAAGIVGLIKTVLCLKHKQLVPSLHFNVPNAEIDFEAGPFYVNTELKEWESENGPLRAGVSSFGIGGTNAHVILEEPPRLEVSSNADQLQIITLSAKTKDALTRQRERLKAFLMRNEGIAIADLSWTLQNRRAAFTHRLSFAADDMNTVISQLADAADAHSGIVKPGRKELIFMFPGQGSQYLNMGKSLYEQEPVFREIMDQCFTIAKEINGIDYKVVLYPENEEQPELINQTRFTQPILFIFEYSLAKQLGAYGLNPDRMIGHSVGEYVAACLSGVLTLKDALYLVIKRGELIQSLPPGAMLGIAASVSAVEPLLSEKISIAAINTKESCVLSGEENEISKLEDVLMEKGIAFKRLHTSHAFHSEMMEPVTDLFSGIVKDVEIHKPVIPYISNVTAREVNFEMLANPEYWSAHIRGTVRFSEGLENLLSDEHVIFIEVGPGKTLSDFVRQHQDGLSGNRVLNLIRHPKELVADRRYLYSSLGKAWVYGAQLNWTVLHQDSSKRTVSLPSYPFEKVAYPIGHDVYKIITDGLSRQDHERREDFSKWFYEPTWKRMRLGPLNAPVSISGCHLVFMDDAGVAEELVTHLKKQGEQIIQVRAGNDYACISDGIYEINPAEYEDYGQLFSSLGDQNIHPENITHLFGIHDETYWLSNDSCELDSGFYSVLHVVKQINNLTAGKLVNLNIATSDLQPVFECRQNDALKSLVSGMLNVVSQENPLIRTKHIDISLSEGTALAGIHLLKEITTADPERFVAYRFNHRWVKGYEAIQMDHSVVNTTSKIKKGGVYLITGGLGNLGFAYAKWLQDQYQASLILTGRRDIIIEEESPESSRLRQLQESGPVHYFSANGSSLKAMERAIYFAELEFGPCNGVIHAAGIVQGRSVRGINFLKVEDCEEQFDSKVKGVDVLVELFRERTLDFCLLVSSLSTVLGGKEFAAYAAANTYLDYISQSGGIKNCISINYDGLNFGTENVVHAMDPTEMIKVLEAALSLENVPQLIISVTDLHHRIARWTSPPDQHDTPHIAEVPGQDLTFNRENLTSLYTVAATATESRLQQLFETFFALGGIGTNDNFFDLGGDSLKAMTISNHIYKLFDIELSLKDFYTSPTIRSLAKEIDLALTIKDISKSDVSKKYENETVI